MRTQDRARGSGPLIAADAAMRQGLRQSEPARHGLAARNEVANFQQIKPERRFSRLY